MKPTFDEWFEAKHGATFEELYQQDGAIIVVTMKALSRLMREYVSAMVLP